MGLKKKKVSDYETKKKINKKLIFILIGAVLLTSIIAFLFISNSSIISEYLSSNNIHGIKDYSKESKYRSQKSEKINLLDLKILKQEGFEKYLNYSIKKINQSSWEVSYNLDSRVLKEINDCNKLEGIAKNQCIDNISEKYSEKEVADNISVKNSILNIENYPVNSTYQNILVDNKKINLSKNGKFIITIEGFDSSNVEKYNHNKIKVGFNTTEFEIIIYVSNAQHLDEDRVFISDITDSVKYKDGIWSEEIKSDEYARITFEHKINSSRDITLYAKGTNAIIDVYEKDGTTILAEYPIINSEGFYKIYLTNLTGEQDTFDLKTQSGKIEYNWIVDPSGDINISFITPTVSSFTTNNTNVTINISIVTDILSKFIFNWNGTNLTIYDNASRLMLGFNNLSSLGENDSVAVDVGYQKVNATFNNSVTWISDGKYGGAYNFTGLAGSYMSLGNTFAVVSPYQYSYCLWFRPASFSVPNQTLIGRFSATGTRTDYAMIVVNGSQIAFSKDNSVDLTDILSIWNVPNMNVGSWHHFCIVAYNQSTVGAYFDGLSYGNKTTEYIDQGSAGLYIGNGLVSRFATNGETTLSNFNGTIDEIRFINKSLSSDEVQNMYIRNFFEYNTTRWYFYINQSKNVTAGLDNGTYSYQALGYDTTGILNYTEVRSVTINTSYTGYINITLNYPSKQIIINNFTLIFNGTVNNSISLSNVSLIIDNVINETNTSSIGNVDYIFIKNLSDGVHTWGLKYCDINNICFYSDTREFFIDKEISNWLNQGKNNYNTRFYPGNFNITNIGTLWNNNYSNELFQFTSFIINKNILYTATVTGTSPASNLGGKVLALNSTTGVQIWNYTTGSSVYTGLSGFITSPLYYQDKIYLGDKDGVFYCLNATNGSKIWSYVADNYFESSAKEYNSIIYTASDDGYVYAFNSTTGAVIWKTRNDALYDYYITTTPAISNGILYYGELQIYGSDTSNFFALNATNGSKIWNVTLYFVDISYPLIVGDLIFQGTMNYSGLSYKNSTDKFYAINTTSRSIQWSFTTGDNNSVYGGSIFGSPTYNKGVIIFCSSDKTFYALNSTTGSLIWTYNLTNIYSTTPSFISPLITNNDIVVITDYGKIIFLNLTNGLELSNYSTLNWYYNTAPSISNDTLYIAGRNGTLYALRNGYASSSDTTPPNVTFQSQTPNDINTINVFGNNLTINYSINDASGINLSTIRLYYKANSTSSDVEYYQNGTAHSGFFGLNYSSNISDIFSWILIDNEIYKGTYNFGEITMENTIHIHTTTNSPNDFTKIELLNVSATDQYGIFEIMANSTPTANPLRIYYCNSTYTSGRLSTSANCIVFATLTARATFNHTYTINSAHQLIQFAINTSSGKIGTIKVTNTSQFWVGGASGWSIYNIADGSRSTAISTTSNGGITNTAQTYTVDSHLHQYNGTDSFWYYVCANDTLNNQNCTSLRQDLYEIAGLPPTSVNVYSPSTNIYSGNININYTEALSPNGYAISYYNISLAYPNGTFIKTIQTNNSLNLSYIWNSVGTADGNYTIKVRAVDNLSQSSLGFSEEFGIDNTLPQFSNLESNNNTLELLGTGTFGVNVTNTNGTVWLEIDGVNISATNSSSTIFNATHIFSTNGTYTYRWWAYGSGLAHMINKSSDSSYFVKPDTTPPTLTLTNKKITILSALKYQISASDNSGLSCFTVNDTTNFAINCSGYLKNNTLFDSVKIYYINITVNDTLGNLASGVMYVNVTAGATGGGAGTCRYKKFGYWNDALPFFHEPGCV